MMEISRPCRLILLSTSRHHDVLISKFYRLAVSSTRRFLVHCIRNQRCNIDQGLSPDRL